MCCVHAEDSCIPNARDAHKGGTPTASAFIHTATNCPLTQIHTLCNFMLVINNTRWPFPILAWLLCMPQSLIKFHICERGHFSPVAISPRDFIRPLLAGTWTLFTKMHTHAPKQRLDEDTLFYLVLCSFFFVWQQFLVNFSITKRVCEAGKMTPRQKKGVECKAVWLLLWSGHH